MNDLQALLQDLSSPRVLRELTVLAGCLVAAWLLSRLARRNPQSDSIWFGRRILDGLLFPLLALALVWGARKWLGGYQPVAVLKVAVPVLTSLAVIRLSVLVLSAVFPVSGVVQLIERFVSWLAWIAAALWVLGWLQPLLAELDAISLSFGKTQVSLRNLIEGTLSAGLMLVLTLWLSATIERHILRDAVNDLSLRKIASNSTRAVLLLLGLLFALSAVGVDLTALSVLGGALGVGLGFGLQKLASNYVSGFVILFERSLRIGDTVRVDNFEGRITDIKTRYTLIKANNGRESIVPNEKLITERIENLSLADSHLLMTSVITVGYDSPVEQVQALLADAARGCERVLPDPAPAAYLSAFGADGLEFTLAFWIGDPDNGQLNVRSAVNCAVLASLRAAGIEVPYPQRVVHWAKAGA